MGLPLIGNVGLISNSLNIRETKADDEDNVHNDKSYSKHSKLKRTRERTIDEAIQAVTL